MACCFNNIAYAPESGNAVHERLYQVTRPGWIRTGWHERYMRLIIGERGVLWLDHVCILSILGMPDIQSLQKIRQPVQLPLRTGA